MYNVSDLIIHLPWLMNSLVIMEDYNKIYCDLHSKIVKVK